MDSALCNQVTLRNTGEKKAVQPSYGNFVFSLCRVHDGSVEIQMPLTQVDCSSRRLLLNNGPDIECFRDVHNLK